MSHYRCCCNGTPLGCCPLCADHTPRTLTVTITGTSIIGACTVCAGGASYNGPGGNFDGVYTLTRGPSACCWSATITTDPITDYYDGACTTERSTTTSFRVSLCKYTDAGTDYWSFVIVGSNESTGNVLWLFLSLPVVAASANCLSDLPTFTNISDGSCNGVYFYPGTGGTAVVSFGAGDVIAVCE